MSRGAKEILENLKGQDLSRGQISVYFDKALWAELKQRAGSIPASRVLEELAKDWILDLDKPASTPIALIEQAFPALDDDELRIVLEAGESLVKRKIARESGKPTSQKKRLG